MKTTSIEEKNNFYPALASALDPKLAARTLEISLGDELPTSRATYLVARVGRESEHPEIAWAFAKAHMKQLLAKTDALGAKQLRAGIVYLLLRFRADRGAGTLCEIGSAAERHQRRGESGR